LLAYHFLKNDMTSYFGNEPPWKVGETRAINDYPILGYKGYHSSPSWYKALKFSHGYNACKVEVTPLDSSSDDSVQVSSYRTLVDYRFIETLVLNLLIECYKKCCTEYEKGILDKCSEVINGTRKQVFDIDTSRTYWNIGFVIINDISKLAKPSPEMVCLSLYHQINTYGLENQFNEMIEKEFQCKSL